MENEIDSVIDHDRLKRMVKPTILINPQDLKNWMNRVDNKIVNYRLGFPPHYRGIPIETRPEIQTGSVFIYDDFKF
tara:strand:+ start:24 stop:251 length:228 start_codon:yes stop_codon:yes gene_type:complete